MDEDVIVINGVTNKYGWVAERNINQTGYATIPLTNGLIPFGVEYIPPSPRGYADFGVNSEYYITTAQSSSPPLRSYVLRIHDEEGGMVSSTPRTFGWQQDISKHVPNNVRILNSKVGLKFFGTQVVAGGTSIILSVTKYLDPSSDYLNLSGFPTVGTSDSNITGTNNATLNGATINATPSVDTVILNADLSSAYYITGDNYALSTSLYVLIQRTTANDLDMLISPVVVKYRW